MHKLKLITLNIEGDHHFDRIEPFIQNELADIVCLQEVYERDLRKLVGMTQAESYSYAPLMTIASHHNLNLTPDRVWGVAMFSRIPNTNFTTHYYVGNPTSLPTFDGRNPNSNNRAVVVGQFPWGSQLLTVATTHFTWALAHEYSQRQIENLDFLFQQLEPYKEYILCGDFNAHRGEDTYNKIITQLTDHIPPTVTRTIDEELHRVKGLELVVDYIFSTPRYRVSQVEVVGGLSDHKAVKALIEIG